MSDLVNEHIHSRPHKDSDNQSVTNTHSDIFFLLSPDHGNHMQDDACCDGSSPGEKDTHMAQSADAAFYDARKIKRATLDAGATSNDPSLHASTTQNAPDAGIPLAVLGPTTKRDPSHGGPTSKAIQPTIHGYNRDKSNAHATSVILHSPCRDNRQLDILSSSPQAGNIFAQAALDDPSGNPVTGMHHATLDYLQIYDVVRSSKLPNYMHARIPLPHALNMNKWRSYLRDYPDKHLCDFLEYGWPMNYTRYSPLQPTINNHTSALDHPSHINLYILTETQHGALLGPFDVSPFLGYHTNPLMTREKRDSDKRRIIMDLSWPIGASVNTGIPKDTYLGVPYKLKLPTVDDAISMIRAQGRGCYLYGLDLERAYRQLRSDPLDWPLLGLCWDSNLYFDVAIPFGIRWGAMACSRTTEAICHIHTSQGHSSLCYIDDFFGVSPPALDQALQGFHNLKALLIELGVKEATEKAQPPTTKMFWIGVEFDSMAMVMRVPYFRIEETLDLASTWINRKNATRRHLQQLLGKLFYISQCVRPARLFVSRMLDTLRAAPHQGVINLSLEFKQDLLWFLRFLPDYNGIHLIDVPTANETVELDSCLTGCGGVHNGQFYHTTFPSFILNEHRPICHLEMLNIVVAVKLWAPKWKNNTVTLFCDNAPAINVLSSGRGRDSFLLQCAREIWLLSAKFDFVIKATHMPGSDMTTADALSRIHLRPGFNRIPDRIKHFKQVKVPQAYFQLTSDI